MESVTILRGDLSEGLSDAVADVLFSALDDEHRASEETRELKSYNRILFCGVTINSGDRIVRADGSYQFVNYVIPADDENNYAYLLIVEVP